MMRTGILLAALAALSIQPGVASAKSKKAPPPPPAAPVPLPYQSINLSTAPEAQAFYAGWHYEPIWIRGGVVNPAASDLLTILRRAPLDGLASGPQVAAQLEFALQQAATGTPQATAYAEHSLSEALLLYAQVMDRQVPGMTYGYDYLKPKPVDAAVLLSGAAGAPSLQLYVQQIANPNSVYDSIRAAAWQQMQQSGATVPDPRVVANLDRARGMPGTGKVVLVNTATATLYMYDNGVPVDSMKVIVGDPVKLKLPTPMISSMIFYAVHNPYWNAPDHLVKKNIAPLFLSQGMSYLKWRGYHIMKDWTADSEEIPASQIDWKAVAAGTEHIRVRQDPGPDNFMGKIKYPFANPQDIFLHDSPEKELFTRANRMQSNGCIRLQDAQKLGQWLLGHDPYAASTDKAEYAEPLPQGVPVYVTYLTAQPQDGQITWIPDSYGLDPAPESKVASN